MIAFSTSWNSWKYSRAEDMIREIKDLGFSDIELNFSLTSDIVDGMLALKKQGQINVLSVHNFCPIPDGVSRKKASPDMFALSETNQAQRKKGVYYTKRSIDTAAEIGARVVVIHAGRVKIKEQIRKLALLYSRNKNRKFQALKDKMIKERRSRSDKFLTQTLRSLEELCAYADKKQVKLGIENRYYFNEMPSFEEMDVILNTFRGSPLYYWHDVGHAQVYENLDFHKHKEMLEKFGHRMIGIHLHDIQGIDDHRAPLAGDFDFKLLKPYLNKETLKILEVHHPATGEEIIRGKDYLDKLFQ